MAVLGIKLGSVSRVLTPHNCIAFFSRCNKYCGIYCFIDFLLEPSLPFSVLFLFVNKTISSSLLGMISVDLNVANLSSFLNSTFPLTSLIFGALLRNWLKGG